MVADDSFYMKLCLNEAWRYQALTYPNPPVGALILDRGGRIIALEAHKEAGSAHAELSACIEAVKSLGDENIGKLHSPHAAHKYLIENYKNAFEDYTIYVTLEPCMHLGKTPSCAFLLKILGFSKIVTGTIDPNEKAAGAGSYLQNRHRSFKSGVLKNECDKLIYPFIRWQNDMNFVFFKLAKHQNGSISGKTVSCKESRNLVHKIRSKIDLLIIGGDTIRSDRPLLDTRYANSTDVPDLLIYTSKDDIDRNIPLFKVKNREVFIENSFKRAANYKHIMIEGGEGMFHHTQNIVDYYLFFTTPKFTSGKKINLDANMKSLHCFKNCSDTIEWFENLSKATHEENH